MTGVGDATVGTSRSTNLDPPNVPLLRASWSLLDGIWGILNGSWGVLEYSDPRVLTFQSQRENFKLAWLPDFVLINSLSLGTPWWLENSVL